MAAKRKSDLHISWTTITYRSVALVVVALALLAGLISYLLFPHPTKAALSGAASLVGNLLGKVGVVSNNKTGPVTGAQEAHFTNIDGTVRVRKANSNLWVSADYSLPLERGDVVQTSAEGMAKIVFADGTNYTIKQDSLIVIEEHSRNASQQTQVAVQVTTGTVDLTTATYAQGSRSQVVVAGARANFAPESSAMVKNDPRRDQQEILVKKGSSEVMRKNEVVRLTELEKVTFRSDSARMAKTKEIGPPVLIAPANMMPIFVGGHGGVVDFTWSPVFNVSGYRVRVSKNPYFSSTVLDRKVERTELRMLHLAEGAYYWAVQSIDENGRESVESEKNRFTIIPRGPEKANVALELLPFVQHGRVIEVRGKTEPNARVMVNGQEVPVVKPDGSFNFFTQQLPNGENVIAVTAHGTRGAVHTETKTVVIY